jgi:hypothetical protein
MTDSAISPSKSDLPEGVEMLEDFIASLQNQQINYEKSGKYVEAESLRLKVQHSKKELERRKEYEMESRHQR